jgi:hypothetical protein
MTIGPRRPLTGGTFANYATIGTWLFYHRLPPPRKAEAISQAIARRVGVPGGGYSTGVRGP